jgi:uncharacterized protein with HEPN domain
MSKDILKLKFVLKMILDIENFLDNFQNITSMLKDNMAYNATLMCLLQIGETLNKLEQQYETLQNDDIKGAYNVRNFIAHDYDGIRLEIIEDIIRNYLPKLKETIQNIIKEET